MVTFQKLCCQASYHEAAHAIADAVCFLENLSGTVPEQDIRALKLAAYRKEYDRALSLGEKLYARHYLPAHPNHPKTLHQQFLPKSY